MVRFWCPSAFIREPASSAAYSKFNRSRYAAAQWFCHKISWLPNLRIISWQVRHASATQAACLIDT